MLCTVYKCLEVMRFYSYHFTSLPDSTTMPEFTMLVEIKTFPEYTLKYNISALAKPNWSDEMSEFE